jgi:two-component system CheB/CheR fusion protein
VLSAQAAQNFALALHELATNAAKYGALSVTGGRVVIEWAVDTSSEPPTFTLHWQERDGPTVKVPRQKGFGTTVLERVMAEYAEPPPHIEFAPGGVNYRVTGPLEGILATAQAGQPRP